MLVGRASLISSTRAFGGEDLGGQGYARSRSMAMGCRSSTSLKVASDDVEVHARGERKLTRLLM
jgi:hypothetical protein